MQTIASVAERLDMSAEEALEKLRYMLFEVDTTATDLSDEACDLLFEIDDDPDLVEKYRTKRLKEIEAAEKAAEKKRASAKKASEAKAKKAAAKKKAATKKPAAKKKAPAKKKAAKKKAAKADEPAEAKPAAKKKVAAVILPEGSDEAPEKKAVAEILPPAKKKTAAEKDAKSDESEGPKIVIGTAIDHDEHKAEVIRADGTHLDASEADIPDAEPVPEDDTDDDAIAALGPLAEAERLSEEREKARKSKRKDDDERVIATPDPRVVAEVIRKAEEKKQNKRAGRGREQAGEVIDPEVAAALSQRPRGVKVAQGQQGPRASRKTGKTARKRQKKMERMRQEEDMRRSAAAAVREYQSGAMGATRKKKKRRSADSDASVETEAAVPVLQVEEGMTVENLAAAMDIDVTDVILMLMELNVMATKNHVLSLELIKQIAEPEGYEIEVTIPGEEAVMSEEPDDPADLEPRAPVVTVMGHVDHGKTSLLDQVRKASVAAGEAGGITQHIAAYEVQLPQGRVVFLDTPGHEAFTAMRARGAHVTDVVVLVVAADDGVMPQTREAIDHARAAEVPIVVAVNKCDKPGANPEKIRQELAQFELLDEQWGGKTTMRNISALKGDGVDELMEILVLETELLELRANPKKSARGAIIESEITRGMGPVAWVLVRSGTLRVGDVFLAGETYGRVRAMHDSQGKPIEEAGPSTPVVVQGFSGTASAGDQFIVVENERIARSIADQRAHQAKMKSGPAIQHVTLEDFHAQLMAGERNELNVVLKADVQGSVDVLESTIAEIGNEEVRVSLVHSGVGSINESDILLASASDAVVLGFGVEPTPKAERLAETEGVAVRTYRIIYELAEDVRKSLEGLLAPEEREVVLGHAEIRQVFRSSALGAIAGCMMTDGEIRRDSLVRVMRDGEVIHTGRVGSLRRDRDTVNNVQSGFECGIKVDGFDDVKEGDIIEAYMLESVAKALN